MAGRQFAWSGAALLQLLLGVNLIVMPPTQARSLRFVTLVMRDGMSQGLAESWKGTGPLLEGGAGLGLVSRVSPGS